MDAAGAHGQIQPHGDPCPAQCLEGEIWKARTQFQGGGVGHDRLGCFDMQAPCAGHLGLGSVPRTEEALPLQRGQEQSPLHDPWAPGREWALAGGRESARWEVVGWGSSGQCAWREERGLGGQS